MRQLEAIEPGNIYHIYNCGINGEPIFKEKRNYYYFLMKYQQYCSDVLETYAYALLNNHFHFLVKVKEQNLDKISSDPALKPLNASRQLSHFFNAYAQAINKSYHRHGKLFEAPFKRKQIKYDSYFTRIIRYIHLNPENHGLVRDFREWEFSSWHAIISTQDTYLSRQQVIVWFGSRNHLINYHLAREKNPVDHAPPSIQSLTVNP